MDRKKAAVFILLGQSNAVGHGVPMKETDKIITPLKNVFGLNRKLNQTYDNDTLLWSGYKSEGMNLGEEQDHTYSVANALAKQWQAEIDSGNKSNLPDLHIVHIAIGAQGVSSGYMWNPEYEKKLFPGVLDVVDISLFSFTVHVLSLLEKSLNEIGKTADDIRIHWRGGENDIEIKQEILDATLKKNYQKLFNGFYEALDDKVFTSLHKIVCHDRCLDLDPSGESLKRMAYINEIFEQLCLENANIELFDVTKVPLFIPDIRGNGIFIDDVVHFTPEVNCWVAGRILEEYKSKLTGNCDIIR